MQFVVFCIILFSIMTAVSTHVSSPAHIFIAIRVELFWFVLFSMSSIFSGIVWFLNKSVISFRDFLVMGTFCNFNVNITTSRKTFTATCIANYIEGWYLNQHFHYSRQVVESYTLFKQDLRVRILYLDWGLLTFVVVVFSLTVSFPRLSNKCVSIKRLTTKEVTVE